MDNDLGPTMDPNFDLQLANAEQPTDTAPTTDPTCARITAISQELATVTAARDGLKVTLDMVSSTNYFKPENPYYCTFLQQYEEVSTKMTLLVSEMTSLTCPIPGCLVHKISSSQLNRPISPISNSQAKRNQEVNSDDEVIAPPNKKMPKKNHLNTPLGNTFNLKTSNRFEALMQTEDEFPPLSVNPDTSKHIANTPVPTLAPRKILPPPIMLKITENFRDQLAILTTKNPKLRNRLSGEFIKLYSDTEQEYRATIEYLEELNFEFYVIKPKQERPIKVVIKGLPRDSKIEDIKQDLHELGFYPEKITQLIGKISKKPLPVFLLQLARNITNAKIYEVTTVGYMSVNIEGYNGRGTTQCYRCNKFHHTSENCHLSPRCLKCGQTHETRECLIKNKLEKEYCINCEVNGHMANWSKCPRFPQPSRRNFNNNSYDNVINSIVRPNQTYSNTLQNKFQNQPSLNRTRPQIAPHQLRPNQTNTYNRNSSFVPQTEANYKPPINNNNFLANSLNQTIQALSQLSQLLTGLPEILQTLPQLNRENNNLNQRYALIQALSNSNYEQ